MFDTNLYVQAFIEKSIRDAFPFLTVFTYLDEEVASFVVSINDETVYYSEAFQGLVMDLKLNLLWKMNLYNYLFVYDTKNSWGIDSVTINLLVKSKQYDNWSSLQDETTLAILGEETLISYEDYEAA